MRLNQPLVNNPHSCRDELEKPRPEKSGLPVLLVAAVALIDVDGRVLISQRPEGKSMAGMWEFPGGKLEEGESPEYALMRELSEELGIETRPCCFSPLSFVSYMYDKFNLLMPLYACRVWAGIPQGKEGQALKWLKPLDLYDEALLPADLPLIPALIEMI